VRFSARIVSGHFSPPNLQIHPIEESLVVVQLPYATNLHVEKRFLASLGMTQVKRFFISTLVQLPPTGQRTKAATIRWRKETT